MTLFKSLANAQIGESSALTSSTSSKNPAFPPTAIQLYSSKYIHFISDTIQKFQDNDNDANDCDSGNNDDTENVNSNNNDNESSEDNEARNRISKKDLKTLPKRYEILSYQSVHVPDASGSASNTTLSRSNSSLVPNTAPNLGIWDCRFTSLLSSKNNNSDSNSTSTSYSYLLKSALYKYRSKNNKNDSNRMSNSNDKLKSLQKPTFVLTIDLESMEDVHITLSTMMESVLQSLENSGTHNSHNSHNSDNNNNNNSFHDKVGKREDEKEDTGTPSPSSSPPLLSLPQFGLAPSSSKENGNGTMKKIDNANIIICAILPYSLTSTKSNSNHSTSSNSNTMTYKEKQGLNLILYHLLKYANILNCALCFINQNDTFEDDTNNENTNTNTVDDTNSNGEFNNATSNSNGVIPRGISVREFKHVLRAICCFGGVDSENNYDNGAGEMMVITDQIVASLLKKNSLQLVGLSENKNSNGSTSLLGTIDEEKEQEGKDDVVKNDDKDNDCSDNLVQVETSIYLPSSYDLDLIESVYLRSASCAGVWDANTDSLWVALPPPSFDSADSAKVTSSNKNSSKVGGDEEWLSKLADSVSAYTNSAFGIGQSDGTKSVMEEGSMKSSRTKIRDGSSVVTTSTKNKSRVGRKKPSGASSKKADDKDDVSDFFTDLLKN